MKRWKEKEDHEDPRAEEADRILKALCEERILCG